MFRKLIIASIMLTFLWACDDNPTGEQPPPCDPFPCDTCENIIPWDTPGYYSVWTVCTTWKGKISPDQGYIAFRAINSDYAHSHRNFPIQGLSIMEIATGKIVHFIEGSYISWTWSLDSKTLYYLNTGLSPISELSILTGDVYQHPVIGKFEYIEMSPSGRYLFCSGITEGTPYGVVRWDIGLDTAEYINRRAELYNSFMVVNDSMICSVIPSHINSNGEQGIYYMNVNTKEITHVSCPSFGAIFGRAKIRGVISPDKKKVLFDGVGIAAENDGYVHNGLWLVNLETLDVRQVLERHPNLYFYERTPVWSTNSTFTASWHCRNDSTTLLYEYDLTGNPIRQLTRRETEFWIVK